MNRLPPNAPQPALYAALRLPNFDASWAGPNPLGPGFCFGSEDGRLLYTDEAGLPLGTPTRVSPSGEAINGVARSGQWMAASTREDVTMGSLAEKKHVVVFPLGAHGVTAAPSGNFVAPLGRAGIMLLQPGSTPDDSVGVLTSDKPGMYFYRVAALPGRDGKDLLVSACRDGGIGITELRWGEPAYQMGVVRFDGLDVIDVCAVASRPESPAVAALGRDGTLILVRNAFHSEKPVTIKFNTVQGTAYRLLASGQNVFVLTSSGLHGLMGLASRLVIGSGTFHTRILVVRMEAVDANLAGDRWLLAVTPDEIRKFDIVAIEHNDSECIDGAELSEATPETLAPNWEMYGVPQRSTQLVASA